ncbi:hypothetical protein [Nitrosomonas cryotolerans]|uniref:hypothetical protein n=1 Tax=Nitrosomonas cryotolerans TaxID=44575 RepID=UPI000ADC6034|nr:hypothetical protein [Nitrosomonas cryotolerans]
MTLIPYFIGKKWRFPFLSGGFFYFSGIPGRIALSDDSSAHKKMPARLHLTICVYVNP